MKLLFVFGTRPEAIKMIPVVKEFQKYQDHFSVKVCVTGQHREMLDQVLAVFDVKPDFDLEIMKKNQDLFDITSEILLKVKEVLHAEKPTYVFVHGDTSSSMATALAAFYFKIPVVHVEAGLRTYDIHNPWPEEMNRQLITKLSEIHLAPTEDAKKKLLAEAVPTEKIFKTGNTVLDALRLALDSIDNSEVLKEEIKQSILASGYDISRLESNKKMILITGHRRENFGKGFENICLAINGLASQFPEVDFVYPVHLNPNVQEPVYKFLTNSHANIFLVPPQEYLPFIVLMSKSYLILTDSGGIQEEAPSLSKPVLVMRDFSERPEAIEAGTAKIVGNYPEKIVVHVEELLSDEKIYQAMSNSENPFGDGYASEKIVKIIAEINHIKLT